ncbi:MAG: hypothetical protein ACJ751_11415 [Niastella sp.]|uniref:hypothetical protein n=1 Tax=Niastella sp. TaxID=1869183 RepID=UPI00389A7636
MFDEVEAILQPLLKKYKITQGDFDKAGYGVDFISTIKKEMPIQEIPGVDASFITTWTHIDTDNEAQIRQVLTEFKKALVYLDKEFINKYNTLQQVYEGQEPMTPKERGEFLTVPGNLRKLVMEMLCNPPADLDSRFERAITAYKEAELTHPTIFKNYDKVASGLQQYFKSRQA